MTADGVRSMPKRPLSILLLVALLVGGCASTPHGNGSTSARPAVEASPPDSTVEPGTAAGGASGSGAADFNVLGREDAPVTIIEFTDLQCPYCARFAASTFPELRKAYVDTGKVRFASRDLPLPMHAFAIPAAVAARCAGEQGHFWDYREALFAAQSRLAQEPYADLARKLGLDPVRFDACRKDGRQEAAVRADLAIARGAGISSTPSFVIGHVVAGQFVGEIVNGAQPLAVFQAKIDALLATPQ
jgi:protein-disulfide isomerase